MLPILCSGITKTNVGPKVLNYLPSTLTDFVPQALFTRILMLRAKLLDDKHLSYRSFIIPSSVHVAFIPSL